MLSSVFPFIYLSVFYCCFSFKLIIIKQISMRKQYVLFSVILLPFIFFSFSGQNTQEEFDVELFNKTFKIASRLYDYDVAFWLTSDYLSRKQMNASGDDYFCYQDRDSTWHVLYGKYVNGKFTPDYHLTVDTTYTIHVIDRFPADSFVLPYMRALHTAQQAMSPVTDTLHIHFNIYVHKNEDQTFTVRAFPGMQPDGTVVYGGEFEFTLDSSGSHLLETHRYMQNTFRGFSTDHPPEKITLDYHDVDEPTLGGILFVWEYKRFFPQILLITSQNISTVLQDHTGQYYWVHVQR